MQHQPEIIFKSDSNALTDPPEFTDGTAFYTCKGRLCGSQQKGAGEPYLLQRLTDNSGFERA